MEDHEVTDELKYQQEFERIHQNSFLKTSAAQSFLKKSIETMQLFAFIVEVSARADHMAYTAKTALDQIKNNNYNEPKLSMHQLLLEKPGKMVTQLRLLQQPLLEMIFCRLIDTFETYMSDAIREVATSKPNMLRSRDQVTFDFVLQFQTMDELVSNLIERKVNELAYLGFINLEAWFQDRMSISIVTSEDIRSRIVELIETRNIIVHNSAKVNDKYLRNVKTSQYELGQTRTIDTDYNINSYKLLIEVVTSIDERVHEKYFASAT